MAHGERLEPEDLQGPAEHLVNLAHKDPLEMLVIQDTWVHLDKGDLRALQGKQAKTEKRANQEILEKLDSLDQQDLEVFLEHPGLLA